MTQRDSSSAQVPSAQNLESWRDAMRRTQRGGFDELAISYVNPLQLRPDERNPRQIDEQASARLERSIREFGLVDAIVARKEDALVIGGHQRLAAAKRIGLEVVPVIFLEGISDERAAALNVVLNNPNAQGEWDMQKLSAILQSLTSIDGTLTGFDAEEFGKLKAWDPTASVHVGEHERSLGDTKYQVVVTCVDENQQGALCAELESRGLHCQLLSL